MAGRGKPALALAIAALLAIAAFGCGGGDSTTSGGATGAATATAPDTSAGDQTSAGDSSDQSAQGKGKKSGGGSQQANKQKESGSSGGGGGSDGNGGQSESGSSSEPLVTPGDTSVQEYGEEASAAEREAASRVLETFMQAREDEDHQKVCSTLSKGALKQLKDLVPALPNVKPGASCPQIFASIDNRTPPSSRVNTMTGPIYSLRVEGDGGFAIYHGTKNTDYTVRMDREAGGWKMGALLPYPLP